MNQKSGGQVLKVFGVYQSERREGCLAGTLSSGISLHHQTQTHDEVEDHHHFRVAPVVMNQPTGEESSQAAQPAENYTAVNPWPRKDCFGFGCVIRALVSNCSASRPST